MVNVKDKIVTVESLSTLHEYDKNHYMIKNNPTGTGAFSLNRLNGSEVGMYSHASGYNTVASAIGSHAEGIGSSNFGAFGQASHSEGYYTKAVGQSSHAEGFRTIANSDYQHVQGKFNIEDSEDKYAHIIGNGTTDKQSNAHTVDWEGNAWYQGDVYVGGTNQDNAEKLIKSTNVISIEYGDELPEAGTVGRIFFKRLTDV